MRIPRILRGIIGTAVSFAVPWSILGAALTVVIELVWNGPLSSHAPFYLVEAAATSAVQFGIVGSFVGAAFAAILAVAGRKLAFEQLTATRVLSLGVAGSVAICGGLLSLIASQSGGWAVGYSVAMGISTLLGGGSALAMLQIARRGSAVRIAPQLAPQLASGSDRIRESHE